MFAEGMKGTTHALVGGLAGALTGQPGAAFVAGVASHVLLDVVPHHDDNRTLHLIADGCAALAVLILAVVMRNMSMAAGVIGGVIPDLENLPDIVFRRKGGRKIFPSHWWEHDTPAGGRWAALETVVLIAAAIGLAVVLRRTGLDGVGVLK
jgi:hypothetical protein